MNDWTEEEIKGFKEWDKKRKKGELGIPLVFKSAKELRIWLDNETYTTSPINRDVIDPDLIEATTRIFVSDLPWYERFLIWLFPRMYDIREYKHNVR